MNRFEQRTEQKKAAIIENALLLFKENGVEKTKMEEIAKNACVSKVSIYNYFGDKENLISACIKKVTEKQIEDAYSILAEEITFEEKLRKVFSGCFEEMNIEISTFFSLSIDDKVKAIIVNELNSLKKDVYRAYIEEGKKVGYINKTLSTDIITFLFEQINTACATHECSEEMIQEITNILFNGLRV